MTARWDCVTSHLPSPKSAHLAGEKLGFLLYAQGVASEGARIMNKTILQGKWRRTRGTLKSRWGELTDNDRRQIDGKIDQIIGLFQERYGYTRQEAAKALARYQQGCGQYGRRPTASVNWGWLIAMIGLSSAITAGGFALARFLSARQEAAQSEFVDQDGYLNPEIELA
jgi:uncharacterized protein YjbJ (UPF0337 family)